MDYGAFIEMQGLRGGESLKENVMSSVVNTLNYKHL